jgi:hypothetical protein
MGYTNMNLIKEDLKQYYGTENYYKHFSNANALYTDGFRAYMIKASCFWLFDIIATEFHDIVKSKDPDKFYLKVSVKDSKATNTLRDWEDKNLYTRQVGFTTHPEGEIEFPFGWDGTRTIISLYSED